MIDYKATHTSTIQTYLKYVSPYLDFELNRRVIAIHMQNFQHLGELS